MNINSATFAEYVFTYRLFWRMTGLYDNIPYWRQGQATVVTGIYKMEAVAIAVLK